MLSAARLTNVAPDENGDHVPLPAVSPVGGLRLVTAVGSVSRMVGRAERRSSSEGSTVDTSTGPGVAAYMSWYLKTTGVR